MSETISVNDSAVEAAASAHWDANAWERYVHPILKNTYRVEARAKLTIAAPYIAAGVVTDEAVLAVAKFGWENRGNGAWEKARKETKELWLSTARKTLNAALPHMK